MLIPNCIQAKRIRGTLELLEQRFECESVRFGVQMMSQFETVSHTDILQRIIASSTTGSCAYANAAEALALILACHEADLTPAAKCPRRY